MRIEDEVVERRQFCQSKPDTTIVKAKQEHYNSPSEIGALM